MRVLVILLAAASMAAAETASLADAAKSGDMATVQTLLRQKADVNQPGIDGATALHWASNREDVPMVEALIRAGANVRATNRHGVSPLLLAALKGNAAVIDLLLKAGADPNTALPEGETALMTAARTGRVDAVNALIERGANLQAKEKVREQTALMWAAAQGHADVVRLLIRAGADTRARSKPSPPATGRLGGAAPTSYDSTGFGAPGDRERRAAAPRARTAPPAPTPDASDPHVFEKALAAESRPRAAGPGLSAFLFAVRAGQSDAAMTLLESGVDVNDALGDGTSALNVAIVNGHYDLAKQLIDKGANPKAAAQGWTALHQLVLTRRPSLFRPYPFPVPHGTISDLELMAALIDRGADVNAVTTSAPRDGIRSVGKKIGATPFFFAAKGADAEAMRFLVSKRADPFKPNDEGTTPLMVAAGVGIWRIGESPGTNEEALEAVKYILSLGGDVTTVDMNGETAVHGAAHRGSPELIKFLAGKGASLDMTNKMGWTPLTIAGGVYYPNLYEHYPEAFAMLKELGAKEPGTRRPIDAQPQQEGAPIRATPGRIEKQ
jgi:ankyrin repeat protein